MTNHETGSPLMDDAPSAHVAPTLGEPAPVPIGAADGSAPSAPSTPSPLAPVLFITFLCSIGTGAVTNGVAFLAESAYGFTAVGNFALAACIGLAYVPGALLAGPALRRLARNYRWVTTRGVLVATLLGLGLLCMLPITARWLSPSGDPQGGQWALWVLVLAYSPLTGVLWPIVESYLSGGRRGPPLRRAIGRFNITWAGAIVVTYWGMAPLIKERPLLIIALLGALHIVSIGLTFALAKEPPRHLHENHEAAPDEYRRLLAVVRFQLPASYLVLSALSPYLPTLLGTLGVAVVWKTPVAATWAFTRLATFAVMGRWGGWHGRWYPAAAGAALLVAGFAAAVLSPLAGAGAPGIALLMGGLAVFGVGMGVIYAAALYYAMEVGNAEVDAGGAHEALIGLGYVLGPACGLAAAGAAGAGVVPQRGMPGLILTLVAILTVLMIGFGAARAWRSARARTAANKAPGAAGRPGAGKLK